MRTVFVFKILQLEGAFCFIYSNLINKRIAIVQTNSKNQKISGGMKNV